MRTEVGFFFFDCRRWHSDVSWSADGTILSTTRIKGGKRVWPLATFLSINLFLATPIIWENAVWKQESSFLKQIVLLVNTHILAFDMATQFSTATFLVPGCRHIPKWSQEIAYFSSHTTHKVYMYTYGRQTSCTLMWQIFYGNLSYPEVKPHTKK